MILFGLLFEICDSGGNRGHGWCNMLIDGDGRHSATVENQFRWLEKMKMGGVDFFFALFLLFLLLIFVNMEIYHIIPFNLVKISQSLSFGWMANGKNSIF